MIYSNLSPPLKITPKMPKENLYQVKPTIDLLSFVNGYRFALHLITVVLKYF